MVKRKFKVDKLVRDNFLEIMRMRNIKSFEKTLNEEEFTQSLKKQRTGGRG
ncbi:MAG UNVERIFIED_CONTAM: hypothetical protein LVQ98_03875 [Rickettsiaceae bacterium]|jgi:predicted house-cleaning noncanonical NTP pyrophosphatase (MazG superfamily)